MRRIVALGANGQVGSEVGLLLAAAQGLEVIPVVRSSYAGVILERLGFHSRIGSLLDESQAPALLAGADLVVDFSLPRGLPTSVASTLTRNIQNAVRHSPRSIPYVYISSTMALGMPQASATYKYHVFPRTQYSAQKRLGEHVARVAGLRANRPVYVLRLGEVHGDLQSVSRQMLERFRDGAVFALPNGGDVASDMVWAKTIAGTISTILDGHVAPGTYTVVETPDWSLRSLYEHYASALGTPLTLLDSGPPLARRSFAEQLISSLGRTITDHREFLVAQFLPRNSRLETAMKFRHLARMALREINEMRLGEAVSPSHRVGPVPGRRLSPEGTRAISPEQVLAARRLLHNALGPRSHLFPLDA